MKSIKSKDAFIETTKSQLKLLLIEMFVFAKNSADRFGFRMVKILNAKTNSVVTIDTNTFVSKSYFVKFRE